MNRRRFNSARLNYNINVIIITPFPLYITMEILQEYGITIKTLQEYGITIIEG